jgi:hypothetical protein
MNSFAHPKTVLVATLVLGLLGSLRAADATGRWKSEFETPLGPTKYTYELKADGDKLTGKAIRERNGETNTTEIKEGKIKGDEISFVEQVKFQDSDVRIEYSGKLSGDEMKLARQVGDFGTTDIVAKREKEAAPAPAVAVAGKWQSEFDSQVGHQKYLYEFKLDGDKLTGKATRNVEDQTTTNNITGKVTGSDISFTEPLKLEDQEIEIDYSGKIAGDEMKLTRKVGDFATTEIVAKRVKETPAK